MTKLYRPVETIRVGSRSSWVLSALGCVRNKPIRGRVSRRSFPRVHRPIPARATLRRQCLSLSFRDHLANAAKHSVENVADVFQVFAPFQSAQPDRRDEHEQPRFLAKSVKVGDGNV